jgi:hypothetical protein
MLAGPYKQTGVGEAASLGLSFSGSRMCNIWGKKKVTANNTKCTRNQYHNSLEQKTVLPKE